MASGTREPEDDIVRLRLYLPPVTPGAAPGCLSQTAFLLEPTTAPVTSRVDRYESIFSKDVEEDEDRIVGRFTGFPRPVLGPTTVSSLDLAKSWLGHCDAQHSKCGKPRVAAQEANCWLPTRLLYFTAGSVKLIETKETKPTAPYLSLSHRWGFADEEKMTLNKRSYSSLRGGVPLISMPRLFREAMIVALYLGVNYIWIDAFCILQDKDDRADWRREAGQMQKVYSHSFCNISAADATSCSDTLFNQLLDPEEILSQTIHLNHFFSSSLLSSSSSSNAVSTANAGPMTRTESFTLTDLCLWRHQVDHALVNTHAWVPQERVPAPRVLHFGRHQLFWECCLGQACEAFPMGDFPVQMVMGGGVPFKRYIAKRLSFEGGSRSNNKATIYMAWSFLVQYYTTTNLSFASDKLIAISGLAKLVHNLTPGDDYLAG